MAIITDSLGRRWNSALHPRDRKGRFIHTFRLVKLFDAAGSSSPWGVGRVDKINDEGHIDITVTKSRDGHKTQAGQKVTLSADKLESVNERADLRKARAEALGDPNSKAYTPNANVTEKKALAKQSARQKERSGSGPRAFGMATGFSRADGLAAERVLENPDGVPDRRARLLTGLWLDHERNAGVISDQDFIESLDELGVDPNLTDSSPDGRTGLQQLVDEYNAENPDRKAVVPRASWVEWDTDKGRIGYTADIVSGKAGKSYIKSNLHDISENSDGTWDRSEPKATLEGDLSGDAGERPDFPSPEDISEALEGKFEGIPNKVNANVGGKKFSFTKGDDDDIYEVSVTDDAGEEVYSGEHDTSDTPSLGADLYESATGEEYTDDIGGSDDDILDNIPDVDEETGEPLIPEQTPEENAKPEEGPAEDGDEEIADLPLAETPEEPAEGGSDPRRDEPVADQNGPDHAPIEMGKSEIPEGAIRVYHYTPIENVEAIREQGLLESRGRGDDGLSRESEPSRGVWASTRSMEIPPSAGRALVELYLTPEQISSRADFPRDGDDLDEWAKRNQNIIVDGDVPADQIIGIHEPWHSAYHQIVDDPNWEEEQSWLAEEDIDHPEYGPYVRAYQYALNTKNTDTKADLTSEDEETADDDTDIPEVAELPPGESTTDQVEPPDPDAEPRVQDLPAEGEDWPASRAEIPPEEPEGERSVWDAIDAAELNGEPADYKDGWKVQKEEAGEDGTEEQLSFVDPDGYKHPFDDREEDADEDGLTSTRADVDKAFEDARDRYNANRDQAPAPTEEPTDDQNQITEALEKSVIDGDPVPLRDGWALQVSTAGEDENEEAADFIAPDGSVYPFDHTEVYEDPDSGKSLDRRPDADMERDFQRTQAAHQRNEERRAEREATPAEPEAAAPEEASPEQVARLEGMNNIELQREKSLLERDRGSDDPEVQAAKAILDRRQAEYDAKYGKGDDEDGGTEVSPEDDPSDGSPAEDALEKASSEIAEKQADQDQTQDDPNHGLTQEQGDRIRKSNNIELGRMTKDRAPGMEAAGRVAADELERRRQEEERRQKEAREAPAEEPPAEEESAEDLTEEPLDGRMSNEELDAKISEGFAGHKIEPTDELRRLFREQEEAVIRLNKIRTLKDERAWMDRWRAENLDGDTRAQARAQARDALEAERREAHEDYRAKADARSKAFIDEIRKQNDIPDPNAPEEEVTEDDDTDTGADSSVPDTDGVPGRPEPDGEEVPEEPGDGAGSDRGNRSRVNLAGKEIEVDDSKKLKSAIEAERAVRLEREGFSNPDLYELDPANAADFRRAVEASKAQNAYGAAVPSYTDEEYAQMRLFVTADGKTGIALAGDIMLSSFSSKDAADKRPVPSMHAKMVALGARRAASFDTHLPEIHAASGFVAVARVKWDDANAPEGWDKGVFAKWNSGEPDTVYYAYDPDAVGKPYHRGNGILVDNPEEAKKVVDSYLAGNKDLTPKRPDEPEARVADVNGKVDNRREALFAAARGEVVEDLEFVPNTELGHSSKLRKLRFENGTVAILKPMDDGEMIDNNMAYEQLVEALGGKTQVSIPFFYNNEQHLLSDYVVGSHVPEQDLFDEDPEWMATLQTPEARAIAVADFLSMQNDRHAGNFLMTPDGIPVAIDNDNSVFEHQLGMWSQFEDATFDASPEEVRAAVDAVRPWFVNEGLQNKWDWANERAEDFAELHARKNGQTPEKQLNWPELVDPTESDLLTDEEVDIATDRSPMTYTPIQRQRQAAREAADTDIPERIVDGPRGIPNYGPLPSTTNPLDTAIRPERIIRDERDLEAERAGPRTDEPKHRRELNGGWSEVHQGDFTWLIDPDGNHHILMAPGMYKRFDGHTPSVRRAQIINQYNNDKGLPSLPEKPQFFPRGLPYIEPWAREEKRPPRPDEIPGATPTFLPLSPTDTPKNRRDIGNGWIRETGGGQDHLIAPTGKRWDLTQQPLEGDTPEKLIKRIRRGYYLEVLKDNDQDYYLRGAGVDGPDDTIKHAAMGMLAEHNDLNFERHEPEQLEGEDFPPNEEQQPVADAVLAGKHTLVNAKAGTGKTTVLAIAARRIKRAFAEKRIGYIVFNKSVQVEGEERMPDNVEVRTSHSLGWALAPDIRGRFKKGLKKNSEIASHIGARDLGEDTKVTVTRKARAAVDEYAKSADDEITEEHFKGSTSEYSDNERAEILRYANKIWKDVTTKGGEITVTQDQMRKRWALARPRLNEPGWGIEPIDILFIDEAQDTPPVLAKVYSDNKALGVQLVVVGDPDQAINGFTGAENYMDDVGPEMDTHLPLEKSYRYGPEVADVANRFLQFKQSLGRVFGGGRPSTIERDMQDPKAILTRTNAGMLAHVWEEMIEKERKVGVPQGTKQDLKHLVKSAQALKFNWNDFQMHDDFAEYDSWEEFTKAAMSGDDAVAAKNFRIFGQADFNQMNAMIDNLIEENPKASKNAAAHREKLEEGYIRDEQPNGSVVDFARNTGIQIWKMNDLLEKHGFVKGVTGEVYKMKRYKHPKTGVVYHEGDLKPGEKWMHQGTPEERDAAFKGLMDDIIAKETDTPDVTISTAHKAKGLEWESVKIGDDFKAPKVDPDTGDMIMPDEQEINLAYVAVTRAERRLDPGSLNWIFALTDDNGGVRPTEEPDPDDLDARVKKRETDLDDQKRHDAHVAEEGDGKGIPYTPERPEAFDEAHNGTPEEPGDYIDASGLPPHVDPTTSVHEAETGDYSLDNGWSYDFNDKDTEDKMGVTLYDPKGHVVAEILVPDDLTTDELVRELNTRAADASGDDDSDAPDPEPLPTEAEATPEPDPAVERAEEQKLLQAFYSLNHEMGERDLFDGYRLARRDSSFTGWKIIDPNGEEHTIQILVNNGTRKIPRQRAAADLIQELRNREVNEPAEVPEQDLTFDERYPDPSSITDADELKRKADELMAMVQTMDRTDPEFINVMTKALAYTDADRGGPKLAARSELSDGNQPGEPISDDNGHRVVDPDTDYLGADADNFGFIETQIPSPNDDTETVDWARIKRKGLMWDLDDPNYFARVTAEAGGSVRVHIFRENGNKPAIPVDNFTALAQDTSPAELAHMALDSTTRHKNKRRKSAPDVTDEEVGRRVWDAVRTGNREGLTEQELEWAVQLEYTMKSDANLDFEVLERAIAAGRNPTMTNFLKYMRDQNGAFRFWAKGNEAGSKMRVGDHAWQWFEDTDKGRAFRRGEGPPDVRHGRIVALPTHSQPNATIWAHDENGEPMWTKDKKTGEPIPLLYRYHLNRVTKFHGLDQDGFALDRPAPAATAAPKTSQVIQGIPDNPGVPPGLELGDDPAVLEGTPDVEGVKAWSNYGKRLFQMNANYDNAGAEAEFDRIRQVTNNWDDLRHGDAFMLGDDTGTLQYDEETDQMFLYGVDGQYYGAQDGFDFRDDDTTQLTDRLEDTSNGFDRVEKNGFERVPQSHIDLHYATNGPGGEYVASFIEHYYAMGGHEVKIQKGGSVPINHAENFAAESHKALKRMGASIEGLKMQFFVPTYDQAFDPNPALNPEGVAMAFVQPIRPNVIQVNPALMKPTVGPSTVDNFMPTAHAHPLNVEYTLIHEFGHVMDGIRQDVWTPLGSASIHPANQAFWEQMKAQGSEYGRTNPIEAYAEAWAQWVLGGPGSNTFADAYAEFYGWDAGELGPPQPTTAPDVGLVI